jgi:hypothetical protein
MHGPAGSLNARSARKQDLTHVAKLGKKTSRSAHRVAKALLGAVVTHSTTRITSANSYFK